MIRSSKNFASLCLLSLVTFVCAGLAVEVAVARETVARKELATIAASEMPPQARELLALIRKGGPFPYRKDGVIFGNREKRLPTHPRGFYREYTVKTPGAKDRGARRIVCGGDKQTACYFTDDHYATFRKITE